MKLSENEAIVKDFKIIEDCLGAKKTERDVMITFTKLQEKFDYFDVFMTWKQIEKMRNNLNWILNERNIKNKTL